MGEAGSGEEGRRLNGIRLWDSHAHLADPELSREVAEVLERARGAGVEGVITVATDLATSRTAVQQAEEHSEVWATVGIHPHEIGAYPSFPRGELQRLAAHPRVVALGETGLDYHYRHSAPEAQREGLRRHMEMSRELGLPVVLHCREAFEDLFAILEEEGEGPCAGVLHCFTGGPAEARKGLALGLHLSLSGIITFRGYAHRAILKDLPADRVLLETDAPYLAPVPHRGRRNEPAFLPVTAAALAAARGEPAQSVAEWTRENTLRLFRPRGSPS